MTEDDFDRWLADLNTRFPSVRAWLAGLPDPKATLRMWLDDTLADIDLSDALRANRVLMQNGEVQAYNRDEIPAKVRRIARDIEAKRRPRSYETGQAKRIGGMAIMKPTLEKLLDAKSDDERRAILKAAFPHDDGGPRYRCPICCDTGYVHCYSPVALEDALKAHSGEIEWESVRLHTMAIACSCALGAPRREDQQNMPRYNTEKCVRVNERTGPTRRARLQQWAEVFRPPDYVPAFDAWSDGAETEGDDW